jgi:hypothetical protein
MTQFCTSSMAKDGLRRTSVLRASLIGALSRQQNGPRPLPSLALHFLRSPLCRLPGLHSVLHEVHDNVQDVLHQK